MKAIIIDPTKRIVKAIEINSEDDIKNAFSPPPGRRVVVNSRVILVKGVVRNLFYDYSAYPSQKSFVLKDDRGALQIHGRALITTPPPQAELDLTVSEVECLVKAFQ